MRHEKEMTLDELFDAGRDMFANAMQGVCDLFTRPGIINADFKDVHAVMSDMGMVTMARASASGEDRAIAAARRACAGSSPGLFKLGDINLHAAKGLLVNVTAGPELSMDDYEAVRIVIRDHTGRGANVVIGTAADAGMKDELRVTVYAPVIGGGLLSTFRARTDSCLARTENSVARREFPMLRNQVSTASGNSDSGAWCQACL